MGRLFGADGIRGLVNQRPLVTQDLERLGRVLGYLLRRVETRPRIVMGRDTRESCQRLARPFVFGLRQAGANVIDVGIIPTAGVSYLTRRFSYTAGIMISASHNPVIENGLKLFDHLGHKLPDEMEAEIESHFFSSDALVTNFPGGEWEADPRLAQRYTDSLALECAESNLKRVPMVVDCAQGASSHIMTRLVDRLGLQAILLNAAPDGTNANVYSGSEHVRRYPQVLSNLLREQGWQVGVAFDGDADRVLFVDQNGKLYDGDSILAMLALSMKDRSQLKGNALVTTPARNTGFRDHMRREGVALIETERSGDKYVVTLMENRKAVLGGEQIGHLIVMDKYHVTGDGVRTAWLVLRLLAEQPGVTLHELTGCMRKYPQVLGAAIVPRAAHTAHLDGIPGLQELQQQAWAGLPGLLRMEVRFASTEPALRIMLESDGSSSVKHLAAWARRIGLHVQADLGFAGYPFDIIDNTQGGLVRES